MSAEGTHPRASATAQERAAHVHALIAENGSQGIDLGGTADLRAPLSAVNLAGTRMRGANLAHADLSGADLTGVLLAQADLTGAILERANASDADLSHAILADARLGEARLQRALLEEAILTDANLRFADLSEAVAEAAAMERADLWGAKLEGADFSDASLRAARIGEAFATRADFSRADLRDTMLVGTDFTGARMIDADLRGTNLKGARLAGADLSGARLNDVDLGSCDLAGTRWNRARLERTLLDCSQLGDAVGEETARDYAAAVGAYVALERNFISLGETQPASWAYRRKRRMQKAVAREAMIAALRDRQPRRALGEGARYFGDLLVEWTSDYGESVPRVLASLGTLYLSFLVIYGMTGSVSRMEGVVKVVTHRPLDLAIFSLSAMTTSGTPSAYLMPTNANTLLLSGIQALLGIFLTGLLGFVAGNRIRR